MWVLFNDLKDDPVTMAKCQMHTTGPQASKYCADGGVYYAYNYIEDGDLVGHVDYPWGANLLQSNLNINFSVSNSSLIIKLRESDYECSG